MRNIQYLNKVGITIGRCRFTAVSRTRVSYSRAHRDCLAAQFQV